MKKYCLFAQALMLTDIATASSSINTINDSVKFSIIEERHYSIRQASSLDNAEQYINWLIDTGQIKDIYDQKISQNTYVIFDIDETLLHITSANFSAKYFEEATSVFEQYKENNKCDDKKMNRIHKIIYEQMPEALVDNRFPAFINKLQASGVKTIAISAIHNIDLNGTKLLDIRFNKLKQLGIDFSKSYPDLPPCNISKKFDIHYSSGIISSGSSNKGSAFTKFYNHYAKNARNMKKTCHDSTIIGNLTAPRQIIFLDDICYNINSIGELYTHNKINYVGIYYTACDALTFVAPYNAKTLYYQIKIADKKSLFVNDNEVVDYLCQQFLLPITSIRKRIFKEFLKKLNPTIEMTSTFDTNETDNSK